MSQHLTTKQKAFLMDDNTMLGTNNSNRLKYPNYKN